MATSSTSRTDTNSFGLGMRRGGGARHERSDVAERTASHTAARPRAARGESPTFSLLKSFWAMPRHIVAAPGYSGLRSRFGAAHQPTAALTIPCPNQ